MNPRLVEFARSANFDIADSATLDKCQALSRLILQECISICNNESAWWKSKDRPIESSEAATLAKMLDDHFSAVEFSDP